MLRLSLECRVAKKTKRVEKWRQDAGNAGTRGGRAAADSRRTRSAAPRARSTQPVIGGGRRNQSRVPAAWVGAGIAAVVVIALVAIYAVQQMNSSDTSNTPTVPPTAAVANAANPSANQDPAVAPTQTAIAASQIPDQSVFGPAPGALPGTLPNDGDVASGCWTEAQRVTGGQQPMQWSAMPAMVIDPSQQYTADLVTNYGTITWQLLPQASADAVNSFVCLALAGYYNNTPFHRIVDDFVIQGGDPTGTGTGGPGYTIPDVTSVGDYAPGMVSMARSNQPNSSGSQFFINTADNSASPSFQSKTYINFARVIGGYDVIAQIATVAKTTGPGGENSQPVQPVTLQSVTIHTSGPGGAEAVAGTPAGTPNGTPAGTPEMLAAATSGTPATTGTPSPPIGASPAAGTPAVAAPLADTPVAATAAGTPIATPGT